MIHTIIMFLWCFVLNAIPFKRTLSGILCLIILIGFGIFTYNDTMNIIENGVILVGGE